MKLIIISDTHKRHWDVELPAGDVLVHCGDITINGEIDELYDFAWWLAEAPFKNKIVISGNHDWCFQNDYRYKAASIIQEAGGTYLQDSGCEIDGKLFWGSPWTPYFGGYAFNLKPGWPLVQRWHMIPENTNVLITHGPGYGKRDKTVNNGRVGCKDLMRRIRNLPNLQLHCCGHIHNGYGQYKVQGVAYVNAAICDNQNEPTNKPIIVNI